MTAERRERPLGDRVLTAGGSARRRPPAVRAFRFGSHLNFCATVCAAFGVVVGALGLAASLLGADVFITLGTLLGVDGLGAGLLGLLVMPVLFAFVGLLLGALTYLPLRWLLCAPALFGARRGARAPRSD